MVDNPEESKQVEAKLKGYYPLCEVLIEQFDFVTASVFGIIWRYCQWTEKKCTASQTTLANKLGVSRSTIIRHADKLVKAGYLRSETTPGIGITYYDTSKIKYVQETRIEIDDTCVLKTQPDSPTCVTKEQVPVALSNTIKESLIELNLDDDESNQISEILESKTAIKPINQQTVNDLKSLMIDKGRDVGGLTIDDLLAGIQDHATNPKAEAPTFATIGGLVRWAVTFKRNAKGKRKGGKGGHEFNKNNPPVYYQGDPDPEELNAYIEFVRERCIKAGYIMPNQAFPEDDTERNQLIDDFKSGHRIDEFKEYLQTIKQPQEAIPF